MKKAKLFLALVLAFVLALPAVPVYADPEYDAHDVSKLVAFFEITDGDGVKNGEKLFPIYDPNDPGTWIGQSEYYPGQYMDTVRWKENGRLLGLAVTNCGLVGDLDLSGCSEMAFLYCSNNNITSLNLSGCSGVNNVFADNNAIGQVFLEGTESLGLSLDLHSNLLARIDLSGVCEWLSSLDVSDNRLTELDLLNINSDYVNCSHNELTSLTVTDGLTGLICNDNELTELILETDCIWELNCGNNAFTSLDLTGITNLRDLDCDGCPLTELHFNYGGERIDLYSDGHGTIGYAFLADAYFDPELGCSFDRAVLYAHPYYGWELDAWYDEDGNWVYFYEESDILDDLPASMCLTAIFEATGEALPGDANLDGSVDISDALYTLRCAMGLLTMNPQQLAAADINGDGSVDLQDALLILRTAMELV